LAARAMMPSFAERSQSYIRLRTPHLGPLLT
jgi:hypothetical protein